MSARGEFILGISAYYHDSAAVLLRDGSIVAAAQEERFTRKKHDARFPANAVRWCLESAGIDLSGVSHVAFYDKPFLKFERLLETYLATAPRGFRSFLASMPVWAKEKLFMRRILGKELSALPGGGTAKHPPILFPEHHRSHAASAFFPSPFERSAVLCLDGVGEWATTSAWLGEGNRLTPLWQLDFPHSLGLLYSAFTYYCGFKVNSGEYKLMGLAPYGEPRYADRILGKLIDLKDDGTFRLDLRHFDFATGLRMTAQPFHDLFGGPPRAPEAPLAQREMDLAASIQAVTEEIVLRLAATLHRETGAETLCLAGGVALNCVANGRLVREGPFPRIWIQPAAGDAGGALGAATAAWHEYLGHPRTPSPSDAMSGAYLGPSFDDAQILSFLESAGASWRRLSDDDLLSETARHLSEGGVVGWFQGRMEFGPRALGNRSILGDPRNPRMQSVMNLKIKFRESFRPFAPSVLAESASDWFGLDRESPYMLLVAPVLERHRIAMTAAQERLFGIEKLNVPRSTVPAITHVDHSARVQTVHRETNPRYHELIRRFGERTGCPMLVNTSFNVRGEPIVHAPADAYRCFMRTGMDRLAIGNYLLKREDQPAPADGDDWRSEFELD